MLQPPQLQKLLKFFGQNGDNSGKSTREKILLKLSKPDLKATFSDVCLVKTEFKSNDLRIQIFVFEKPYIVYMCIVEIHEMKQGQNQNKRRPTTSDKTCCDTLQKYHFFFSYPYKNAYSRKLKDRFPPPLLQCCLQ